MGVKLIQMSARSDADPAWAADLRLGAGEEVGDALGGRALAGRTGDLFATP